MNTVLKIALLTFGTLFQFNNVFGSNIEDPYFALRDSTDDFYSGPSDYGFFSVVEKLHAISKITPTRLRGFIKNIKQITHILNIRDGLTHRNMDLVESLIIKTSALTQKYIQDNQEEQSTVAQIDVDVLALMVRNLNDLNNFDLGTEASGSLKNLIFQAANIYTMTSQVRPSQFEADFELAHEFQTFGRKYERAHSSVSFQRVVKKLSKHINDNRQNLFKIESHKKLSALNLINSVSGYALNNKLMTDMTAIRIALLVLMENINPNNLNDANIMNFIQILTRLHVQPHDLPLNELNGIFKGTNVRLIEALHAADPDAGLDYALSLIMKYVASCRLPLAEQTTYDLLEVVGRLLKNRSVSKTEDRINLAYAYAVLTFHAQQNATNLPFVLPFSKIHNASGLDNKHAFKITTIKHILVDLKLSSKLPKPRAEHRSSHAETEFFQSLATELTPDQCTSMRTPTLYYNTLLADKEFHFNGAKVLAFFDGPQHYALDTVKPSIHMLLREKFFERLASRRTHYVSIPYYRTMIGKTKLFEALEKAQKQSQSKSLKRQADGECEEPQDSKRPRNIESKLPASAIRATESSHLWVRS
jgi:hypothetical protein